MAETVHLYLKANGEEIQGEPTQISLGRENSIECLSFASDVETAREAGSGMATGRRTYKPIVIKKRIDKATPLIAKALCENQVIEGVFKFFRPSPSGDGTTQQFFSIAIKQGRVAGQEIVSLDTYDPDTLSFPPIEQVEFVFHTISWLYSDGGVTHEDTWSHNR